MHYPQSGSGDTKGVEETEKYLRVKSLSPHEGLGCIYNDCKQRLQG